MPSVRFQLRKLAHSAAESAEPIQKLHYRLNEIELDPILGQKLSLEFTGSIICVNCGRATKKTFGDGHCFPCSQKLAACDLCILKPELCHFRFGTCREPDWAETHCLIPHVVYLSNTTGLKVGITREHKRFERWGDQGAVAATAIARVPERYIAGLVETALKAELADKADWRALIRGLTEEVDLDAARSRAQEILPPEYQDTLLTDSAATRTYRFEYPVLRYPEKAVTHSFEKAPLLEGTLEGIRGQYIFIDGKALNIRKHIGYEVEVGV